MFRYDRIKCKVNHWVDIYEDILPDFIKDICEHECIPLPNNLIKNGSYVCSLNGVPATERFPEGTVCRLECEEGVKQRNLTDPRVIVTCKKENQDYKENLIQLNF